jgi:hypothetical protein
MTDVQQPEHESSSNPGSDPGTTEAEPTLAPLLDRVPEGWTPVVFEGHRYGLSRTSRADGRSVSVYAEELGGSDVVSANVYRTSAGDLLRPCEMPADKVLAFLRGWTGPAVEP